MSNSKLGGKKMPDIIKRDCVCKCDNHSFQVCGECFNKAMPSHMAGFINNFTIEEFEIDERSKTWHNVYISKNEAYEIINSLSSQLLSSPDDLHLQLKIKKVTT